MTSPHTLLIAPLLAVLPLLTNAGGGAAPHPDLPQRPLQSPAARGSGGPLAAGPLWVPPLGVPLDVSGPYRAPPNRYGAGHRGIDLVARPGGAVIAPAGGSVSFVGSVVDREVVSIRIDGRTVYSLEPVSSELAVGAAVVSGETIGGVAGGGHCEEECVHLGVRVDGEYVNPLRYFLRRPVLLPLE